MEIAYFETKVGWIKVVEEEKKIIEISFEEPKEKKAEIKFSKITPIIRETYQQIQEYLEGKRERFSIPIQTKGTDFQEKVWDQLKKIPYGETISYGELAKRIGNGKAARAVGMASHNNPIGIIIPCHRVIGKNGKLVGYAGGMDKKEVLLEIERKKIKE